MPCVASCLPVLGCVWYGTACFTSGGRLCAPIGVPWRLDVLVLSAPFQTDCVKTIRPVLRVLKPTPRQGTPMEAHKRLPESCPRHAMPLRVTGSRSPGASLRPGEWKRWWQKPRWQIWAHELHRYLGAKWNYIILYIIYYILYNIILYHIILYYTIHHPPTQTPKPQTNIQWTKILWLKIPKPLH